MPNKTMIALSAVALTLMAGCAGAPPIDPDDPGRDACGARAYAPLVGTPIAAVTLPAGVRTIGPDTIVTEDFVSARVNVFVDARGVITGVRCG